MRNKAPFAFMFLSPAWEERLGERESLKSDPR
jgi:hypothetical protein